MDASPFSVCEWTVSLYNDKSRRWTYGRLAVHPDGISFTPTDAKGRSKTDTVPFVDFVDVKKTTIGLVFGAVYILKKTNEKVWLSSLEDREGVYATLRHFWMSLLHDEKSDGHIPTGNQTVTGQKLLAVIKDSENTLSKAAVQLQSQGQQIDRALGTMSDLHGDLDVAENLVSDLDSWFGRWRMPNEYKKSDPCIVNRADVPEIFECEVVYTKLEAGKANMRNVGILRLMKSTLTILTLKQRTEYQLKWADISELRVVTPYELVLVRFQLGKPDLKYGIVSANMAAILKLLDKCARYKLRYSQPPEKVLCTRHMNRGDRTSQQDLPTSVPTAASMPTVRQTPPHGQPRLQVQMNQSRQTVSDMEADEISRTLAGLKTLALSVQAEESLQNEKLDSLTATVDNANERLKSTERRVKRMC